ncbi:MAG: tetratricopeptide repeat protein [Chitinophagales bacterium]
MMNESEIDTLAKINWLIQAQKYDIAEKMALELRAARPDLCNVYSCLARIFFSQRRMKKAKVVLQQMLNICPDFSHTYYLFSSYYLQLKKYQDALEMIEKALQFEPEDIDYQYQLSVILYNLRYFEDCQATCENILAVDAAHLDSLTILGVCLSAQGEEAKAIAIFENLQKQYPNYSELYACKGVIAMRKGNNKKATKLFKEALRLDPTSPIANVNMETLKKQGEIGFLKKMLSQWENFNRQATKYGLFPIAFLILSVKDTPFLIPLLAFVFLMFTLPPLISALYEAFKIIKDKINFNK